MAASGNFCTWNAIMAASNFTGTLTVGNTKSQPTSDCTGFGTMAMTTGKKWYFEARAGAMSGGSSMIGIMKLSDTHSISNYNTYQHSNTNLADAYYVASGDRILNGVGSTVGGSYSEDDVIGVAVDLESSTNTITFYKNNSGQGSLNLTGTGIDYVPSLIRVPNAGGFHGNWGQDSTFGGAVTAGGNADGNGFGDFLYSVPSGHLAVCSGNLGISDDIDPAQTDDNYPQKQFGAEIFAGNGGTQTIQLGDGFQPDCVWLKNRGTANSWLALDSSRGYNKTLQLNNANSEGTNAYTGYGIESNFFGSTGIIANDGGSPGFNASTNNYIVYGWRANGGTTSTNTSGTITSTVQANQAAGFSIVLYTGESATRTVGHGLNTTPNFIVFKSRGGSRNWGCFHTDTGLNRVDINTNSAMDTGSAGAFGSTLPSSSVFTIGDSSETGKSEDYVAYCWHDVEGYSKFGSFEGNSNADGPFVYLGFRPRLVFVKAIDATENWQIRDTARHLNTGSQTRVYWNSDSAEGTASTASPIDFLANGFKVRGSNSEINTNTFIYGAWGDVPYKYNNAPPSPI